MSIDMSHHVDRKHGDHTGSVAATLCVGLLQHFVVLSLRHFRVLHLTCLLFFVVE